MTSTVCNSTRAFICLFVGCSKRLFAHLNSFFRDCLLSSLPFSLSSSSALALSQSQSLLAPSSPFVGKSKTTKSQWKPSLYSHRFLLLIIIINRSSCLALVSCECAENEIARLEDSTQGEREEDEEVSGLFILWRCARRCFCRLFLFVPLF